jgi:hypothetical protein
MSANEIASLPGIGLTAKGVGSVIERSKGCIREWVLQSGHAPERTPESQKENSSQSRLSRIGDL